MNRKDVYKLIDGERNYQDGLGGKPLCVGEEILLAAEYLERARKEWTEDFNSPEMGALAMLRKVAGIAVRAMENHGAPVR